MINDSVTIAEEYYNRVEEISYKIIGNKELAKDAVQETWIEIIESLPKFKGKSKVSTWIYTITTRTIYAYLKKHRKQPTLFDQDAFSENIDIDNSELDNQEWINETVNNCIKGAIHCLSENERLIYLLFDVAGLSSIEISEILSISDVAIRKKMSRSRSKLYHFLNNQCILFNSNGTCRCKIIKNPKVENLHEEIRKIRQDIDELSLKKQCNKVLISDKSFLENLCCRYKSKRK